MEMKKPFYDKVIRFLDKMPEFKKEVYQIADAKGMSKYAVVQIMFKDFDPARIKQEAIKNYFKNRLDNTTL